MLCLPGKVVLTNRRCSCDSWKLPWKMWVLSTCWSPCFGRVHMRLLVCSTWSLWISRESTVWFTFNALTCIPCFKDLAFIFARQHYKIHTQHLGLPAVLRHATWLHRCPRMECQQVMILDVWGWCTCIWHFTFRKKLIQVLPDSVLYENFRPFRSLLLRKNCPEAKQKPKGDQNSEQSVIGGG